MIDKRYLDYINIDYHNSIHEGLIKDIYYFYFNHKLLPNERIILKDGNKFNLDRDNMIITLV